MKNFTLIALTLLLSATAQAQLYKDLPKGDYYPGYNPVVKPDASLTLRRQRVSRALGLRLLILTIGTLAHNAISRQSFRRVAMARAE